MKICLHPHAQARLLERGANEEEIRLTIVTGESFPAKFGRTGFRRNFRFRKSWQDKVYSTKQVEIYAVKEAETWLVLTVITRYF